MSGGAERARQLVEPVGWHPQTRVRLGRRREVRVDADVELGRAEREPRTATACQAGRLDELIEPQQRAIERPGERFAAGRRRDLNVIELERLHREPKRIAAGLVRGGAP